MRIYLSILLLLMLGNDVAAQDNLSLPMRTIEVSGVGSISSVPDRFSFSLNIEKKGRNASDLNVLITNKTAEIVQTLIEIGVDKKAIQSLQVQYNVKEREQKGFILSRTVTITLDNLKHYELAIDAVLKLGVNNINRFNYSDSNTEENYQAALQQALLNAQSRAKNMAKVLDLKLGQVISILEQSYGQVRPVQLEMRSMAKSSDSYQPGEMTTEARVKVVFVVLDHTDKT
jgi:uncharacterized protein YggE